MGLSLYLTSMIKMPDTLFLEQAIHPAALVSVRGISMMWQLRAKVGDEITMQCSL